LFLLFDLFYYQAPSITSWPKRFWVLVEKVPFTRSRFRSKFSLFFCKPWTISVQGKM
jgi:hypothetical protein